MPRRAAPRRRLFEHEIESYNTRPAAAEQFFPFDASLPPLALPFHPSPANHPRHLSIPIISQLRTEPRGEPRHFEHNTPFSGIKGGRENTRVSASCRRT